jgi:two-component system NtrC family sensor kinase
MVKERKGKELPEGKPRGRGKQSSGTQSQSNIPYSQARSPGIQPVDWEERYRTLFDRSIQYVIVHDFEGNILDANEMVLKLLGYDREDIPYLNIASLLSEDQLPKASAALQDLKDTGMTKQLNEWRLRRKDGSFVDVLLSGTPIYHEGKPHAILGIGINITERKRVEEALRQSEKKYRTLTEQSLMGLAVVQDFHIVFTNTAFAEISGYSIDELLSLPPEKVQAMIHPEDQALVWGRFHDRLAGKAVPSRYEYRGIRKDGSVCWLEMHANRIEYGGKPAIQGAIIDITDPKQAEEALQKSEERYRTLAENAGEAIFVVQDGVIKFINPKGAELSGYSIEELVSNPFVKFIHPSDSDMVANRYLRRLKREPVPQTYDFRMVRKDGDIRWGELNAVPISWENRPAVLCFMSDITERKQAEEALRQSEERYRAILEKMEDSYFEVDLAGNLTFVNSSACRHLGYSREELIGMSYKSFTAEDYIKSVFQIFDKVYRTAMPNKGFHWKIIRKDGSSGFNDTSVTPLRNDKGEIIGLSGVGRDITERRKMEEQLILTDRLASIGQLAAGIAHELNNPLTGVIGFSDLLLERDLPADVKEDLETVNQEARRAINVIKGLLAFAREQRTEKSLVNINSIIQGVLQIRSYEQRVSNIEVDARLAPTLPQVMGNGAQLQQVFINIIVNAEQAMLEAHGRGKLTIATERIRDIVRASITDDGPGISPNHMKKLFTPFFTTREMGKGTGLGLSICHGIVTEHGGKLYAESEPGKGATFVVELPISK